MSQQACDFVIDKLDFGAHDDLDRLLCRSHHTGGGGFADEGFIDKRSVVDVCAQPGGAIVDGVDVVLAAKPLNDLLGGMGIGVVSAAFRCPRTRDIGKGIEARTAIFRFIVIASGGFDVKQADERVEDAEVGEEVDNAHHQQHPPLIGQRVLRGEQEVHRTGTKSEAGGPAHGRSNRQRDTGKDGVHQVQQRCEEHEGEFQRLGDTGEKGGYGCSHHQRAYCFATFRLCTQVDGQCCAGQAEHHDWKETRLVLANHADDFTGGAVPYARAAERVSGGSSGVDGDGALLEFANIVNAHDIEPEHGVQCVV